MTKETPELVAEIWQLLVEYIPRRDHAAAAEQLFSFLQSTLAKDELEAVADLDGDLSDAMNELEVDEENDLDDYDEE